MLIAVMEMPFVIYRCVSLLFFLQGHCRFEPSCSSYMREAILRHGTAGALMGIKRLMRCHPWGGCGYDPVPPCKKGESNHE